MPVVLVRSLFALIAIFIAFVEGFLNPFALWNLLPVAVGYSLVEDAYTKSSTDRSRLWPAAGYNLICTSFVIFIHMAWFFDWDRFATGSSTSGLVFLFLPVYAFAGGMAGLLVGYIFRRRYSMSCKK